MNDEHVVVDDNEVKAVVVEVLLNTEVIVEMQGTLVLAKSSVMENTDKYCFPRITSNSFRTI